MIWPIAKLIRLHRSFDRLMSWQRIPLWLNDALAFVRYLNVVGWFTTFVYSAFYPRHFYRRMGAVVTRPAEGVKGFRYPFLLRPIPYLIAFVAVLNLLRFLGVPIFVDAEEFSALSFNLEVLALTLAIPVLAGCVMISLLALVGVLKVFAYGLDAITSGDNKLSDAAQVNWWFFRVLFRKRFWSRYRYGELIPALLYYSINTFILVPVAYITFTWGAEFGIGLLPELERPFFAMLMNALIVVVLAVLAITLVYGLVLRPLIYAVFFRSRSWLARSGVCPDFLDLFGEPERETASPAPIAGNELIVRTAYVDLDLERTDPESAYLLWARTTDDRHRLVEDSLRRVKSNEGTAPQEG